MKRSLTRKSIVLGAGGLLAASLLSTAYAATASAATVTNVANVTAAQSHGPSWRTVLGVPNGTKADLFETVVATGQTSGWVFQADGAAYARTGASSWRKVAFPGKNGAVNVAAASSPSNVWAAFLAGAGKGTQLYHWNGRNWTLAKSFPHGASLTGISVLGPNDVWVFGGGGSTGSTGAYHFNGRKWTQLSATPQGGSALSDSDVWAFSGTQVAHYNGRNWATTNVARLLPPVPRGAVASSYLTDIIALAPDDVYATGENANPLAGPAVLLHYNGRTWSRVGESTGFVSIPGEQLASDGKGGLWIPAQNPGAASEEGSNARLIHYSGGRLTAVALPGGAASGSVSRIPGTAEALAAGVGYGTGHGTSVVFQYS
jgi:hypothetical protein